MKILLLVFAIVFVGCVSRVVPLRHQYLPGLYEHVTEKPKAKVWNGLLNFFLKNNVSVRLIDSNGGIMKTDPTNLRWSYESKGGKLNDPQAWVAIERVIYKNEPLVLTSILGEWNIRVKELDANRTYVVVNLVNMKYNTPIDTSFQPFLRASPRSTGVFERMLSDHLK